MNMQIHNSHNPTFCGTRLFSVKLKKIGENGQSKVCDAFITMMDKTDVPLMEKIKKQWHNTLGGGIISNFLCLHKDAQRVDCPSVVKSILERYKFLVVDCPEEKRLGGSIAGIMEAFPSNTSFVIDKLCSCNGLRGDRKVDLKGVGRCLMFAACRFAEELEKFNISLRSVKNEKTLKFYKKIGMLHIASEENHFFRLDLPNFEEFKLNISSDYDIKPLCNLKRMLGDYE